MSKMNLLDSRKARKKLKSTLSNQKKLRHSRNNQPRKIKVRVKAKAKVKAKRIKRRYLKIKSKRVRV